jgi:peptide subunit release factor 1 (eRF1)
MFSERDLHDLVAFRGGSSPVLSVYLNVDPTHQTTDQYRLTLRTMLKQVADQAKPVDLEAVERYFDFEYDWQGRGVAVFSCHDADFWRSYSLAVPVDNHAYVSHRPYVKPLTDVLDAYGRYAVVLVDSEGARMFLFQLGELVDASGLLGKEVRRAKHGGASGVTGMRGGMTARTARREEAVVQRNLKDVAEATLEFCTSNGCRRLVLGGTETTVSQFYDALPKAIQDNVIGRFVINIEAAVPDVQARSLEVIEQAAQQREVELVERMVANWKRGSGAAVGVSDVLAALQEHRASVLLIAAGYESSGYRCADCRYLMLAERDECPLCGGSVEHVEDLVDTMTHRALEQGVEVEIVRGNKTLVDSGSIGALLRY